MFPLTNLPSRVDLCRLRVAGLASRGSIPMSLVACLVASCAVPENLFRFGGAPAIPADFKHAGYAERPTGEHTRSAALSVNSAEAENSPSLAVKARESSPTPAVQGVGFKPGPQLAAIRKQLARLLQNGSMAAVSDEGITAAAAQPDGQYYVQIGSHQARSAAENHWGGARVALSAIISSFALRIRPAELPSQGRFFRVQIGPIRSQGAALDLCRAIAARQQPCFTLAEKGALPSKRVADVPLMGGWASIGPGATRQTADARARDRQRRAIADERQVADAAPLYTVPRLAALPE